MPGQAVGDVTRGFLDDGILEFLQTDGTPIGTITVLGLIFGPPPPGASGANSWNMAVTGGTGAFLGRVLRPTQVASEHSTALSYRKTISGYQSRTDGIGEHGNRNWDVALGQEREVGIAAGTTVPIDVAVVRI